MCPTSSLQRELVLLGTLLSELGIARVHQNAHMHLSARESLVMLIVGLFWTFLVPTCI